MSIDREELSKLKSALDEAQSLLLTTHVQPDGDAIGSMIALGMALRAAGTKVEMTWADDKEGLPPQYDFLPSSTDILSPANIGHDHDSLIALDCASIDRLGKIVEQAKTVRNLVNIDHHPENSYFGQINLVDETYSSTSELIYEVFKELGITIGPDIALCLYVGIVTDTGRFQFSNTDEKVLRAAAELVKLGVEPNMVFQQLYENMTFSSIRLLGLALSKARSLDQQKIVYTVLEEEDFEKTGTRPAESENFIDLLRSVRGTRLAIIFKPVSNGELRVSLRSKDQLDVGVIARTFNGGGHRKAAGFTSTGSIDETLEKIIRLTERQGRTDSD